MAKTPDWPISLIVFGMHWWRRWHRVHVLKAWGGRYGIWLGLGWQSEKTAFFKRAWLRTVLPPYLRGVGLSAGRSFCVRLGVYRRIGDFDFYGGDVDTDGELAALEWRAIEEENTCDPVDELSGEPGSAPTRTAPPEVAPAGSSPTT